MDEPKQEIYTMLDSIPGIVVYQIRPEVLEDVDTTPVVTFYINSNVPAYTLEKDLPFQNVEVTIDIWGKNSKATGPVLVLIQDKMLENNYRMVQNQDIPDPDGYSHLNTRFEAII